MAVSIKKAILWRREIDNHPGMLANTLQPLSEAGADLQVVMAYRYPGGENKTAIELYPVSGKKAAAAQTAGLAPSSISTLLVEGDNRPGLGHAIAKAVGNAGINMSFVMAQVVGRRYSALFGFENETDASESREPRRVAGSSPAVRGERGSSVAAHRSNAPSTQASPAMERRWL